MFFASAIIWQTQRTAMYEIFTLTSGTVIPTSDQLAAARTAFRAEFAILFIYFTSLWTVKLSFLVLFQRLGQSVGRQKIWWWCVTGFTVATGATCIGTMDFNCFLRSLEYIWGGKVFPHIEGLILNGCSGVRKSICNRFPMGHSGLCMCSRCDHRHSK